MMMMVMMAMMMMMMMMLLMVMVTMTIVDIDYNDGDKSDENYDESNAKDIEGDSSDDYDSLGQVEIIIVLAATLPNV